jgi:uncharacterized glyoxalase superfamily protein PhnB
MSSSLPTLYPLLRYRDAPAALSFLQAAFGFEVRMVVEGGDGMVMHAELTYGSGVLMLGSDRDDPRLGSRVGLGWLYVAVEDADRHCERARRAGAEIITDPYDTDHGSRDYAARDLEGNQWHFGTYQPSSGVRAQPLITVSNVPAARDWYAQLLKAQSGHGGEEYEQLLVGGSLILQLHRLEVAHHHGFLADPAVPLGNGVAVWFTVADLDDAVRRADELGASVEAPVHVNPNSGRRELWLRDLDGYRVVLAEAVG